MKKMTKAMLMTALILGSVTMGTAVEANELNTFALDEYVVTATRTLKEIQEVPASVSVITAQDIEKKNATNVREALKGLPGVYIEPTSMSTMSNGIQMRGFTGNNILVLVDGVQVNTAYGGEADLTQVPVENIERIEVLRGAASSIYGGYAVGGVINITTKEAKNIGTHGEAVVSYGSNDTWKKSLQVNSKVNDKWSFGLGYEKSESDGYVSSYIVKTPEEGKGAGSGKDVPNLEKLDNGNYLVGERGKNLGKMKIITLILNIILMMINLCDMHIQKLIIIRNMVNRHCMLI
jgi:iron complex outermembrane receptor protein